MSDTQHADDGHGHAEGGEHSNDHHAEPFVPENSLHDWALVGLAVIAAVGMVAVIGIWMLSPLPEVEASANTPTLESGVTKP